MAERKTLVKIDEDLLAEAKEVLGTTSIVDTVNQSLREVIAIGARRRAREMERALAASTENPDADRRRAWG